MKGFELIFYRRANGDCPVSEFLASLNTVMRYKMLHQLDLLELYGNHPKGDFTKPLGDGLFECRAQTKTDITRILFFFDKNRQIVLTHGFVKKTQRMPASELETAKKYRADYFARVASMEQEGKGGSGKKSKETIGPKWRPKLDEIVAEAQGRQQSQQKSGQRKRDPYQR